LVVPCLANSSAMQLPTFPGVAYGSAPKSVMIAYSGFGLKIGPSPCEFPPDVIPPAPNQKITRTSGSRIQRF